MKVDTLPEVKLVENKKSRDLRVLFVSHTYVVGVNQGKLAAIAATDRVKVGLLVPSNWKALEWNRLIPVENPYSSIQLYEASVLFSGRGGAHIYTPWLLWRVLNDFQPDIVQVEEEVFSLLAFEFAIWSRLTGKPLVVFGWENLERSLSALRQWTCRFVLNTARALIPGNEDGARLMRQWGYNGAIAVMPQMGVDTKFFSPQLLDCNHDEFNIGFLGRLVPEKGIDILFAAARQLQEQGLKFKITLCGSGIAEASLKDNAETQQIADAIAWRGAIRHEQAPAEISKFDVLVLPSRSTSDWKEQFGHVLIEAMAMGVPVIGSSCGEIPNAIGRSDLVFQEGDAFGLAAILKRMICDSAWRQEVKQYGISRVQQLYSHEQIAQRLLNLWQTAINQKQAEVIECA
ncbi:glycosyltransferase [Gloeocapsopsis crepidinum LEGE 06123]|uniref:Glycosyltransferase n=3 Tax=Gloeocapsopsis crepidinum TaxID=693223 RepID=A0ABR9USR7_9CHRO|nr:glycosyltransferase [Gloeocapsopsis crepidinum]MBE9191341.1 glycosyltransferase [Gloeocapsopsis crepidinum LEGE 06123]